MSTLCTQLAPFKSLVPAVSPRFFSYQALLTRQPLALSHLLSSYIHPSGLTHQPESADSNPPSKPRLTPNPKQTKPSHPSHSHLSHRVIPPITSLYPPFGPPGFTKEGPSSSRFLRPLPGNLLIP